MIRVFIVHPTNAISSHMAQTLTQEKDVRVVYQVTTVNEALSRIGNDNCHVVLAAASLPNNGAMTLIKKLRSGESKAKVVVTGTSANKSEIMQYILAGALGHTVAEDGLSNLAEVIRAAATGKATISQEIAAMLMTHVAKLSTIAAQAVPDTSAHAELTDRETDVLALMAKGCSNKVIADKLIIGVGTVKNHVHNVLKKLNLRSRKEAAAYMMHVKGNSTFQRDRFAGQLN